MAGSWEGGLVGWQVDRTAVWWMMGRRFGGMAGWWAGRLAG